MIIDCHGHYTTAPAQLQNFRETQIAHFEDATRPAPELAAITDDEIRESVEQNQLKALSERGADAILFSPKAVAMGHHIGDEAVSIVPGLVLRCLPVAAVGLGIDPPFARRTGTVRARTRLRRL